MAGSSTGFFARLAARAAEVDSLLCVGLDPRAATADAAQAECTRLIDATAEFAAAFKPNSAFFEALGPAGLEALRAVIAHVPEGIPVILDAKRGDIGETSAAYASAVFDGLGAHALTVSPYLGGEAIAPFLNRPEFGAFVLCKTSNPGANEFQGLEADAEGRLLYEVVAQHAQGWSTHDNVGLVVGATDPAAVARVRALAPNVWFLVPGVGAQGGDLRATLSAGLRPDGLGLIINISRSLARAADPAAEARRLRDEIRQAKAEIGAGGGPGSEAGTPAPSAPARQVAQLLLDTGCVRFGQFTLKSGQLSPIYLDLRRLVSSPQALRQVAQAYAACLTALHFDRLAGIPYAALPIATAIALEMGRPLVYPRREAKDYGTRAAVEGEFTPGETAVVIDDLATTGGTKFESIEKLEAAGLAVRDVVVLIDRGQGAGAVLGEAGYCLHAVVTLPELLEEWRRSGAITFEQYQAVIDFLRSEPAR